MAVDCAKVIRDAHDLSEVDAKEIIKGLREELAARAADPQAKDLLQRIALERADEVKRAALVAERQKKLKIIANAQVLQHVARFKDPAKGYQSYLVGVDGPELGALKSIDAEQKMFRHEIHAPLLKELNDGHEGILKNLRNDAFNRDVGREQFGLVDGGGKSVTGNEDAFHVAKVFEKYKEILRLEANRAGADIARLPGHVIAQHHDARLLAKASFEQWRNTILPLLDVPRTFKGADPNVVLENIYNTIITGNIGRVIGEPRSIRPANIADRLGKSRFLHFKDVDAFLDYNKAFGGLSVAEGVFSRFEKLMDDIILMQRLGPNPEEMHRAVLDRVAGQLRRSGDKRARRKMLSRDAEFRAVSGLDKIPGDPSLAHLGVGLRNIENMANLGGATIASFNDISTVAATANVNGIGFLSSYAETFQTIARGRAKGEIKEIADGIGAFADGILASVARRFVATDGAMGFASRLTNQFFKYNGLAWWTDIMKEGFSLMLAKHMARNLAGTLDDIHPRLKSQLIRYGIGEEDWAVLQRTLPDLREVNGAKYLTPDAIAELPAFKGQKKLERALRTFYINEADFAVPTPGARERAISLQGTQPGTVYGELARFVFQFKMFPLTMMTKVWPRIMRQGMPGAIHLAVMTTLIGYMSMSAKDILRGREVRDPLNPKTWIAAMIQGGGAGILGDLLFNDFNQFGRSLPEVAGGPAFGLLGDVARIFSSAMKGQAPEATAKAWRTLVKNTPFANLFYLRTAIDYLVVYQVQELLNPGFLRRMEREIERRNNQGFLFRPSEIIAHGGGLR